jgi:metal-sulfur cluster biosynthetic enzyme
MCTDIGNNPAPPGTVLAKIDPKLFKRWLTELKCSVDESNPKQIVAMLKEMPTVVEGNIEIKPNWHLTAMTDRQKTVCNNFHFKIEATKAAAHYWHYVLHFHPVKKTWHWVGDANPKISGRNDAGGGAAADALALDANRAAVNAAAAQYGLTNRVTVARQDAMLLTLQRFSDDGSIFFKNGIWQ